MYLKIVCSIYITVASFQGIGVTGEHHERRI
jgi:hypothetical protein